MRWYYPLQYFPFLDPANHIVVGPESDFHNCIAWAAGFDDRKIWPGVAEYHWPACLPQEESLASLIAFFVSLGYQQCDDPSLEEGFEKVALFADPEDDYPTHAARQLPNGWWSSKMGWDGVTIEHDGLACIEGNQYGRAVLSLRRPTS